MEAPYKECVTCVAKSWCKRFSGESPRPAAPDWCNPHFRLYKALKMTELPRRFRKSNLHNYVTDDDNQGHISRLKPFIQSIVEVVDEGTNFLFHGGKPGTGKTFHASILLNEYIYKTCLTKRFDFEHPLALYVNYAELMDELRYKRNDEDTLNLYLKTIKDVPLLLLDDVGSGTTSPFTVEQTYLLVNYRYNQGLSTITTTNLNKKQLVEAIGSRSISRLQSDCERFEIGGRDRR